MSLKGENLYWRTAHYLIVSKGYRILQLSKNQQELWLEKTENKEAQIVRLLCHNLDWSNWLQRDIEVVASNGEKIRKKYVRGNLSVLNLYFSEYLPVDAYQFYIDKPFTEPVKGKIKVTSLILENPNGEPMKELESVIGGPLWVDNQMEDLEVVTDQLRKEALVKASETTKAEKEIFHYAKPFFTYIFLAIQIVIFLLMEVKGSSTETFTLIEFGAKFNPLILEGEWWRFITPVFLHIGVLHLFMNSLALYYLGPMVEQIYGNTRFLLIYLIAGFAGTLGSFIFSTNLSAGASGAIFGLFGALLYFGVVFPRLFFRSMGFNMLIVLAINLVFGFTVPGIDNAGHIGGLIGGFAAAGIVHFPRKKKLVHQGIFIVITTLVIAGLLQFGFNHSTSVVDEQSVLILAQDYIQDEEYAQAYQFLNEYNNERNVSAETLFLLSFTEIKLNDIESAKKHLHQVIDLNSDFHEAHYNLALIYLEQELYTEAQYFAKNAVQVESDNQAYNDLLDTIMAYISESGP